VGTLKEKYKALPLYTMGGVLHTVRGKLAYWGRGGGEKNKQQKGEEDYEEEKKGGPTCVRTRKKG